MSVWPSRARAGHVVTAVADARAASHARPAVHAIAAPQPAVTRPRPAGERARRASPGAMPFPRETSRIRLRYRMSRREMLVYGLFVSVAVVLFVRYALWWFGAGHVPLNYTGGVGTWVLLANVGPFAALTALEATRLTQSLFFWSLAALAADAVAPPASSRLRVAVVTTIVPSKEPIELVEVSLEAMTRIRYDGPLDLWLLDEEDDPRVRAVCERLGINHFSRHGIQRYNQADGPFKAKTKAGNTNAWLDAHQHRYDVIGGMDPDHIPTPDFVEQTLGYFTDPDVAYVVAPQVYYRNSHESWIARGADEVNFCFSALTQRGANRLGMPILIGSNHLCRVSALRQVGGYASLIVEDHITGMRILARRNPATGARWRGAYCSAIISHGEGPVTWGAYFSQQMRWSYGIFDIIKHQSWRLIWRMPPLRAAGFLMIQSFYGASAIVFALGVTLATLHLFTGVDAVQAPLRPWLSHWLPPQLMSFVIWFWLQRFYLRPEDRSLGLRGFLLALGAAPIYLHALLVSALGRRLPYVITPKGEVAGGEPVRLFAWHIGAMVLSLAAIAWSLATGSGATSLRVWAGVTAATMALVIASGVLPRRRTRDVPAAPLTPRGGYWARVGVPAFALAALWLVQSLAGGAPGTSSSLASQHRAVSPAPAVPAAEYGAPSLWMPAPVSARFLDSSGPREVALGAFDPAQAFGVAPKISHVFVDFRPERTSELVQAVLAASRDNRVALISWEPRLSGTAALAPSSADRAVMGQIAAGAMDEYLLGVARDLAGTGQPVLLRFAHEMDLANDGLHPWAGGNPDVYIAAWRHVRALFRDAGAHNVRFVWSPGGVITPDGRFESDRWYPGDDAVDLVGFTAFAFWGWEEWSSDRAQAHAFRSPGELLMPRYNALSRYGKPVILPEFGIDLHPTRRAEEQAWLRDFTALAHSPAMSQLAAVVYFQAEHNLQNYRIDWRLDAAELAAFVQPWTAREKLETALPYEQPQPRSP